jgi:hypothetical protein
MKLVKFHGKLVRITDINNNQYEGICLHNNEEFNECEYGIDEESLDILCIKFYKHDIKKVELINNFSEEYGYLEESIVEFGDDLIEEVFESEENEHIYRLLKCIVDKRIKVDKELLLNLLKYNNDERIISLVKLLLR